MLNESSKTFKIKPTIESLNSVFSKIIPKNTTIPDAFIIKDKRKDPKLDNTAVAHWMEDIVENACLKSGILYNRGKGPDIQSEYIDIEFKTRMIESNSYHTIGSTSFEDIITNYWEDSALRRKVQLQFRVDYSQNFLKTVESRIYDFTNESIQKTIGTAYQEARFKLVKDYLDGKVRKGYRYVRGENCVAHFDLQTGSYCPITGKITSGTFQFRISNWYMEQMKSIAITCNDCFA